MRLSEILSVPKINPEMDRVITVMGFPTTQKVDIFHAERFIDKLSPRDFKELYEIISSEESAIANDWLMDRNMEAVDPLLLLPFAIASWRQVWRKGFLPLYTIGYLQLMLQGLKENDPKLIQGATCSPPPLQVHQEWEVESSDLITYPSWISGDLISVGEVEEFFARTCYEVDKLIGESAGVRHFLNYWDDTPRDTLLKEMLWEINRDIQYLMKHQPVQLEPEEKC